jgi:hypothetical protein
VPAGVIGTSVVLICCGRGEGHVVLLRLNVWIDVRDGGGNLGGWLFVIENLMRAFAWMWHCQGYFRD